MSSTLLLNLPASNSTTTDKFMTDCKDHSRSKGMFLQRCSQQVERSVQELLQLLKDNALLSTPLETDSQEMAQTKKGKFSLLHGLSRYLKIFLFFSVEDLEHFATECEELYILFQQRNLEALLSSVKVSVDCLRKRITTRYSML